VILVDKTPKLDRPANLEGAPNADETSADHAPGVGEVPEALQGIVDALDDKRAVDIVVLDLHAASDTLDYFVVATGESILQLKALEDSVRERLKTTGVLPQGVEGKSNRWILLDYGQVIVHLMSPEARTFYDLEGLWADATRLEVAPG
jgi:ribosome-associated protein